jgi:hypothetical protein
MKSVKRRPALPFRRARMSGAVHPAESRSDALVDGLLTSALDRAGLGAAGAAAGVDLARALGVLMERAQQAGGVRPGLTVADLHAILSGVIAMERNLSSDHRGMGLDIVLTGLRAVPKPD